MAEITVNEVVKHNQARRGDIVTNGNLVILVTSSNDTQFRGVVLKNEGSVRNDLFSQQGPFAQNMFKKFKGEITLTQ